MARVHLTDIVDAIEMQFEDGLQRSEVSEERVQRLGREQTNPNNQ
jgi:hypothetical protein